MWLMRKKIIFPYQQEQLGNSFVPLLHHSVEIFSVQLVLFSIFMYPSNLFSILMKEDFQKHYLYCKYRLKNANYVSAYNKIGNRWRLKCCTAPDRRSSSVIQRVLLVFLILSCSVALKNNNCSLSKWTALLFSTELETTVAAMSLW